jgi:hypothetical protein
VQAGASWCKLVQAGASWCKLVKAGAKPAHARKTDRSRDADQAHIAQKDSAAKGDSVYLHVRYVCVLFVCVCLFVFCLFVFCLCFVLCFVFVF